MSTSTLGSWVDLDWLLGLPLEPTASATLWRAVRDDLSAQSPQTPEIEAVQAQLDRALDLQELAPLRSLCLDGEWFVGLERLEALFASGSQDREQRPSLAELTCELVVELHHRLIDTDAPPCPFDQDQRAELLWRAHTLLGWLEEVPGPRPPRLPVVIEQVSRYGALAWMEREGAAARFRAIALLVCLAQVNPESHGWALPAIRERISAAALGLTDSAVPSPGDPLAALLDGIGALAELDPPEAGTLEALRQALQRGQLSLELLRSQGG